MMWSMGSSDESWKKYNISFIVIGDNQTDILVN